VVSKRSDDELAEELRAATDELLFMSESDYADSSRKCNKWYSSNYHLLHLRLESTMF